MRKTLARLAVVLALLIITAFVVIVVNQTSQLVLLATAVSPVLGSVVLWTLLTLYAFCILTPIYLVFSLPKPLRPPETEDDPLFPAHVEAVKKRLKKNPYLANQSVESREEMESGIGILDAIAVERTKKTASQVFITTAISQNGNLDSFLVLAAQSKLVLEIARTYYQRPTLRDLIYLYSNVAATAFVAGELEDLDLAEQVQPIVGALLGSTAGAVPGLGAVTTVFTNSVLTGTANAFLTLRVGVIAQQYCRSVVLPPRRTIRRAAIAQATTMLGGIAFAGSKRVMGAVAEAGRDRVGSAIDRVGEGVGSAIDSIGGSIRTAGSSTLDRLGLRRRATDDPGQDQG